MKNFFQKSILILFIIVLFIPIIGLFQADNFSFDLIKGVSANEFEEYFDKQLFKKQGVQTYFSKFQLMLGISPAEDIVILGKNGFLFVANSNDRELDSFRGIREFSDEHYEIAVEKVISINTFFTNQGVDFLLMIPPDKSTIYEEYVPKRISRTGITPKEEFMKIVAEKNVEGFVFDIAPILLNKMNTIDARYKDFLYYKGDSHWNDLGAFLAFQAYIENKALLNPSDESYPVLQSVNIAPFRGAPDLGKLIHAPHFPDFEVSLSITPVIENHLEKKLAQNSSWQSLFYVNNPDAVFDETVILIRDSFANAQIDYFSYLYSDLYVVHYKNVLMEDTVHNLYQMIDEYSLDRVVLEIVERRIIDRLLVFENLEK